MLSLIWQQIRKSPRPAGRNRTGSVSRYRWLLVLAAALAFLAAPLRAQGPPGAMARVMGKDVTVDNGPGSAAAVGLPGFWVANGSTITVHSGQARLTLVAGGDVYICGPAKMTYLESNGAITLALSFGKVHATIASNLQFRIFTPLVIGTPIAIGEGERDFTVGLDTNDAMCIRTEQGAAKLEEQFTGQQMIVPLGGEFFITANSLNPVPGQTGSCDCDAAMVALAARAQDIQMTGLAHPADEAPPAGPPPGEKVNAPAASVAAARANEPNTADSAAVPPPNAVAAITPTSAITVDPRAPHPPEPDAAHPAVEFSIPDSANESHPIPPPKNPETTPKPEDAPTWKVMMPPLTFSADSPQPPPDPSPRSILLIRESKVEPEWLFTGHVEGATPANGATAPNANASAANGNSPSQAPAAGNTGKKPGGKRHGFWSRMKGLFGGGQPKEPSPQGNQ